MSRPRSMRATSDERRWNMNAQEFTLSKGEKNGGSNNGSAARSSNGSSAGGAIAAVVAIIAALAGGMAVLGKGMPVGDLKKLAKKYGIKLPF
ncbi:hypothetical protein H0194_03130 [Corynebacterium incognita]|uniref:Uncharacterized protein n=1 Tax=Corynebacterium incognita TaxID=2754725 RepID=A0A7G7CR13_9CORY|nr:hypothetical protein [Corynebacterium incognita]QNE90029.1 hypothetical protein H0194_03130 [Corynebacterium incognita]